MTSNYSGQLSRSQIFHELRKTDIFALVGWSEPFGIVFLEAMACGAPVVLANDAGAAEILADGETALFTRPKDISSVVAQLSRLVDDRNLRLRLARTGRDFFAANLTWQHVARTYRSILQDSIAQ